ncbi:Calcium-transporting ATPase 2 [Psilocybe cubensis]|uniref:Calcium-transporting ATPase n=2 Tax=Psilocybe cubensis TaxID=181762 RepID=A0A8H7Y3E3_PSICU|nr:Calcium-transporting ATPase 2 [Psilocybe cubensis]KAH9481469.1 Calcium-transporting ATPase 2 [Psilocybe cubensis]
MSHGEDSRSIPSINITVDVPATTDPHVASSLPPSSGLLSPHSPSNAYGPPSPTPSDVSDSSYIPPSPTLSNHSGNFPTTVQLRENRPEDKSGLSSLGLLNPGLATHNRKASNATSMTDVESDYRHVPSTTTSVTHVDIFSPSPSHSEKKPAESESDNSKPEKGGKKGKKGKKDDKDEPTLTAHQLELSQDDAIDPAPFRFKPYQLAHILDPKNLDALRSFGGIDGLLRGLGTDAERGLSSTDASTLGADHGHRPSLGHKESHQQEARTSSDHGNLPEIVLTEPNGKLASPTGSDDGTTISATLEDRRRVFGTNLLPTRVSKTLLQLMWTALKDKVLILLSIAAAISLALGLFQDFGTPRKPGEPPVDWVEGVAIIIAISIVVIVGSVNDWQKERQFKALNERKEERGVKVIRDGIEKVIDIKEVLVGDIALVEPGEIIPCDGIFISGHNVKCDESGATGESDAIKKLSYHEVLEHHRKALAAGQDPHTGHTDCFMISGSKVLEGVGKYVVVAVGTKSFNGRIMMALRGDTENTPLQLKLNALAELIAKIGSVAGSILFFSLMIRFFVQLGQGEPVRNANEKGIAFVNILIISVTLVVVAVPEGLPLAVTLALAFATKRMTYENLLVRVLGSCETMANASVICTDKTGTLTQNSMTVVAGSIGIHAKFVRNLDQNAARSNADEKSASGTEVTRKHPQDFSIELADLNQVLSPALQNLLNEAIAVNSTAFEDIVAEDLTLADLQGKKKKANDNAPPASKTIFVGSKTETALLEFAKELNWPPFQQTRNAAEIVQMIPFSSERKAMGVVVKLPNGGYRAYFKGASEILAKKSTRHVVVNKDGKHSEDVETEAIDELAQDNISRTIIFYANQSLRTIAICYRDFTCWPPTGLSYDDSNEVPFEDLARDLTLIGITGIEDPLRDGVQDAVMKCHRAGVTVKMCTGDNVLTARSIATQCGIFTKGGIIMEGPVFRQLSQAEMIEIVPRLQVLARSSPEDKKILVETLKKIGEVVGVTGDGTNDGPALKTANVGFSMGIAGTEVAKEASDIILMDDNFSSIVKAIMWGRCVNDAVRKFLQFQISTNVTAVIITFVSAVASVEEESVLSAVQLLWINIIMDTFAALALATDPATEKLLDRKPDKKTAPLFSVEMYKMILMQSIYQVTIILLFHFRGIDILGFEHTEHRELEIKTLVFNAFVFAQIFNSVNCRRLDSKLNIFEGITKNRFFIGITLLEIVIQVLIVFVGGAAFQVTRISGREWGISLALGFVSIPWGAVIRCMPTKPFESFFKFIRLVGKPEVLPTVKPDTDGWSGAINLVRDNLSTFANIRGGRVRSSSFVLKSRSARLSNQNDQMTISSVLTMAPTLMIGAVAAGQAYLQAGSLSDPAHADPSRSSAALWEGKLQIHPETSKDDPVYRQFAGKENIA